MFYLASPIHVMEHVMTTGKMEEGYDPKCQVSNKITRNYSLHCGAPHVDEDPGIHVDDVIIMSASKMLHYAGENNIGSHDFSVPYHNMFIYGCLPIPGEEAKYVCVDLEKDGTDIPVNNINISINIDSIIWTTKEFICRNSIQVYMAPVYGSRLEILKHNDVYVDILILQSEPDQLELCKCMEWLSKRFPMTAIPHTPIG